MVRFISWRLTLQAQDKFTFSPDKMSGQGAEKIPYNAIWISESGMYRLAMRSNLPLAPEYEISRIDKINILRECLTSNKIY